MEEVANEMEDALHALQNDDGVDIWAMRPTSVHTHGHVQRCVPGRCCFVGRHSYAFLEVVVTRC